MAKTCREMGDALLVYWNMPGFNVHPKVAPLRQKVSGEMGKCEERVIIIIYTESVLLRSSFKILEATEAWSASRHFCPRWHCMGEPPSLFVLPFHSPPPP